MRRSTITPVTGTGRKRKRRTSATLMQACLDLAHLKGARTMWLGVWERNERAIAFYLKWGFREVGDHRFLVGRDDMRDLILERELP